MVIVHVITGFFWCGTELTSNNLMMELSPEKNRSFYIASFSMVTALTGSILAYLTGGLLMQLTRGYIVKLNIMLLGYPMNNYHMLFILSALLRAVAIIFFLPDVEEEKAHSSIVVIQHAIKSIKRKLKY